MQAPPPAPPGARQRAVNWCFTLNLRSEQDCLLLDPTTWETPPDYLVYQLEVASTGQLHYQGYMRFASRPTFAFVRRIPDLKGAHFEVCKGSPEQNIAYCTKEGRLEGPFEFGERPAPSVQGARNDLNEFRVALLDAQRSIPSLMADPAYFRHFLYHGRNATEIRRQTISAHPRGSSKLDQTVGIVLAGASGAGKSTFAHNLATYLAPAAVESRPSIFYVPHSKSSGTYWDGYHPGDVVIVDEMSGNRFQAQFLNSLLDSRPLQVPVHGGTISFNSKYVLFTTNYHPRHWYKEGLWPALKRRLAYFPFFSNLDRIPTIEARRHDPESGNFQILRTITPSHRYFYWYHHHECPSRPCKCPLPQVAVSSVNMHKKQKQ